MSKEKIKVFFAAPNHFDLYKLFEKNLTLLGYDVITFSPKPYKYPNFKKKLINFLLKTTRIDPNYKEKQRLLQQQEQLNDKIASTEVFDYGLFLRADLLYPEVIDQVKQKTKKMIAYQYDGLDRFPAIRNVWDKFDVFFAFDPFDLQNHPEKLKPLTNFYFDMHASSREKIKNNSLYFLGSYSKDRYESLLSLEKALIKCKADYELNFYLEERYLKKIRIQPESKIKFTSKRTEFSDYLSETESAGVIVDISGNFHQGLSFRVFESIGLQKKLVTTNPYVKEFDFYNENNILVWDNDTEKLESFLKSSYTELTDDVRKKYAFSNWIRYVFDLPPFQKITLPENN